jgi:hypothetical protein
MERVQGLYDFGDNDGCGEYRYLCSTGLCDYRKILDSHKKLCHNVKNYLSKSFLVKKEG